MKWMLFRITFTFILTLFLTNISLAQSGPTQEFLDSIERQVVLEEYVHTAEYKPTHIRKALHSIEILKAETLQKRGVNNLEEALLLLPSVRFDYDPILGTQLRLRGISSANVAILIDGVPMIGRLDGAIDISQVPLNNVKQIEVIEGPLSTIYGNNAAGGVINIITCNSQKQLWNLSGSTQWESIGVQNHMLNTGIQTKKWYVDLRGRFFKYDKYPIDSLRLIEKYSLPDGAVNTRAKYPWNPKNQLSGGGTLKYKINLENSLILKYDISHEDIVDYGAVKRPQFKPYALDDQFLTAREDVSLTYDGHLFRKVYVEFTSAFNQFKRQVDNKRYEFQQNSYDEALTLSDTSRFNSFYNRLNLSMRVNPHLEVIGGINYTHDAGRGGRIKVEDPTSDVATLSEWAYYTDIRYSFFKGLNLSYSGRLVSQNVYGLNYTSGIKAKYDIGKYITLRASYAQGYRSPDLKELYIEFIDVNHYIIGNINLKPEKSNDIQLTAQYEPCGWFNVKLNGYRTEIKDKISLFQYETLKYNYSNVDNYDVSGGQLDLSGTWKQLNWTLAGSIGFWNTVVESGSVPHDGRVIDCSATVNYMIPVLKVGSSFNYRYAGSQPLYSVEFGEVSVSSVSSAAFMDMSFNKYLWKEKIQLVVGCKNILDTTYTTITGGDNKGGHRVAGYQFINQGRSYFARLGLNF
jgi:outer membrane receptor for ferrienterochelin and colicins